MLDNCARTSGFGNAPQRLAALVGLPALLAELGVPLAKVLEGLPLGPSVFENDENRIPYGLATELLERSARLSKCPHFGLLLGSRFDHRCMGAAGLWMQNAPTLKAALTGFIALQSTATRGATSYLHRHADHYIFGYGAYDRKALGYTQNYAVVIPMAFNIVTTLTGGAARPLEILFSFRRPSDTKPYSDFFDAPVRFDQPQSGLVLHQSSLAAAIHGGSESKFELLQSRAAALMPPCEKIWSDRVKRMIRTSLLLGESTGPQIAKRIGMHPKSMSRHLASEGSSFQALLGDVRFDAARELLMLTDLPIGDIAMAIGYASHSAFDDAFRRWSGHTPTSWRANWLHDRRMDK